MRPTTLLTLAVVCVAACGETREPAAGEDREPTSSRPARAAADSCASPRPVPWSPAPMGVAVFDVNRSTRGMTARIRWMLAPDSSALLVMDDPAAVENDAIPNGLLFATERTGRVFRMDSVWSAAPSPDWRRLAVGRGLVLGGGESQSIPRERWEAPAARMRALAGHRPELVADSLRAHSFSVSGMAVMEGAAVTLVANVGDDTPNAPIEFVALDGWRVRWSCDGADILVGGPPSMVQDDAPSAAERRVSSTGAAPTSVRPAAAPAWIDGPTLDIGAPVTGGASAPMPVRGGVIEERRGRVVIRGAERTDPPRDVGPGIPLAATRGGHFILAIAPRVDPRPHESPDRAVVYRVP